MLKTPFPITGPRPKTPLTPSVQQHATAIHNNRPQKHHSDIGVKAAKIQEIILAHFDLQVDDKEAGESHC